MGNSFHAGAAQRLGLGLARPSATASAKLREDGEPEPDRELGDETAVGVGGKNPTVVSIAPTRVTNMTGFLIIRRGSSFLKALPIAGPAMDQSKSDGALWSWELKRET